MKILRGLLASAAVVVLIIAVFYRPLNRWNEQRLADDPSRNYFLIESYTRDVYTMRYDGKTYTVKCGRNPNLQSEKDWIGAQGIVEFQCNEMKIFIGETIGGAIDVYAHEGEITFPVESYIAFTIESIRPVD